MKPSTKPGWYIFHSMGKATSPNLMGLARPKRITDNKGPKGAKKAKSEPMKVVHIPNPVRLEASAGEFRALVQRLTGLNSHSSNATDSPSTVESIDVDSPTISSPGADQGTLMKERVSNPFDMLGEVFVPPPGMEDFAMFTPSSSMFYEPPIGSFWGLLV